jgi:hypothetical protein
LGGVTGFRTADFLSALGLLFDETRKFDVANRNQIADFVSVEWRSRALLHSTPGSAGRTANGTDVALRALGGFAQNVRTGPLDVRAPRRRIAVDECATSIDERERGERR